MSEMFAQLHCILLRLPSDKIHQLQLLPSICLEMKLIPTENELLKINLFLGYLKIL